MLPLRDVIPSRTTPWVNLVLIGVNALAFLYELMLPRPAVVDLFFAYGLAPAHVSWRAVTMSMFLHTSLLHAGSNLWALWIFGENVEDRLGHIRYLIFYLLAGYAAGLAQVWTTPHSAVPFIGASGAVAGVAGAYVAMFPNSRVLMLVPVVFSFDVVEVPAAMVLGVWFVLQVLAGMGRLAPAAHASSVFALLGGCLAGITTVWLFRRPERQRVEWWG
jgi:rhomboid family protein